MLRTIRENPCRCGGRLPQFGSFRVVVEMESQGKILAAELAGQRRKWIGSRNTTPRGAIECDVTRTSSQTHTGDAPILENGKLYRARRVGRERGKDRNRHPWYR